MGVLKKERSHEVHLGEGANTGAQLPAEEDPKAQCLRRGPIVGGRVDVGVGGTAKERQDCEADVASRRS